MDHVARVEVTLTGEAARLYEILIEAASASVRPGQINRTVLETGLVHHVLMLAAVGAVAGGERDEAKELIEQIGKRTVMGDLFEQARAYWENQSGGGVISADG